MGEITKELVALAMSAMELAADTIETKGVPFKAFVVVEKDGDRTLHEIDAVQLEEESFQAWRFAGAQTQADRVAVAVAGYVTVDGIRSEGIIVEVADIGATESHYVGVQYEVHGVFKKTGKVGDQKPSLIGRGGGFPDPESYRTRRPSPQPVAPS